MIVSQVDKKALFKKLQEIFPELANIAYTQGIRITITPDTRPVEISLDFLPLKINIPYDKEN